MPTPSWRTRLLLNEDLNFLLTNRIPRITATHVVGWLSHIENPKLARFLIWVWSRFTALDLSDAKEQQFSSMHACFTRALVDGARPADARAHVLCSPSDGIVGACGRIDGTTMLQAKGFPYELGDLVGDERTVQRFTGGHYITLRLTSAMYHRFHAPAALDVTGVDYISGDTWNVNPIALARVERLFCKNERAVVHCKLQDSGLDMALVPVAAVLVASIRLHCANVLLHLRYKGPNHIACAASLEKGQEMGWFEHGSTIIVLLPPGVTLAPDVQIGQRIRAGQALVLVNPL